MGLEQERFSLYGRRIQFAKNHDKTLLVVVNHEESDIRLCYTHRRKDEKYVSEQIHMHERYRVFIEDVYAKEGKCEIGVVDPQSKLMKFLNTTNLLKKISDRETLKKHTASLGVYRALKIVSEHGKNFAERLELETLLELTSKIDDVHGKLITLAQGFCKKQEERIGALYL